jgi:adenylate cyclase
VLIKSITSSLRSLGMFIIFIFAIMCIFGSMFAQDIDSSTLLSKFLDYTISFEHRFYDYRMRSLIDSKFVSKDTVLVKIDDYSLEKLGVWPIPRTNYATMIDKLANYGAKVIAMDILFPEKAPEVNGISSDKVMSESIKNFQTNGGRVFIGYSLSSGPKDQLTEAPLEMLNDAVLTRNVPEVDMDADKISRFTFPIKELLDVETGLGYLTSAQDGDGIFRHYQLVANIDTIYYGSLAFNAYEAFIGKKNTIKIFEDASGELDLDGKKMELSRHGQTKIRYVGGEKNFPAISLYDLINADNNDPKMKEMFKNKLVYVGSTALGAHDLRPSPIDSKMPGVYCHMNMSHMLLHHYFYQNSNDSVKYSIILLIIGMIIFLLVHRVGNPFLDAIVITLILAIYYFCDRYYFLPQGYELKLFYSFFCFLSCYTFNTFLKFYDANNEKKQIRGTFARYVAPTIVDEMLKNPDKLHVGGSKMDITCLFSDVRDFTKISEGLTATELASSLNMYMGAMTDIVFDTKGK